MNESDICLQEGIKKVWKINIPLDFQLILNLLHYHPIRKLTLLSPLDPFTLRPCFYVAFASPCILFPYFNTVPSREDEQLKNKAEYLLPLVGTQVIGFAIIDHF